MLGTPTVLLGKEAMKESVADTQEGTVREQQLAIYRQIPGIRADEGEPCLCGVEFLSTSGRRAFSDSRIYHHSCSQCGNKFTTYIEG